jgi:hypothetical protein
MYDGFFDITTCPVHLILDLVIRIIRIMLKYLLNVVWNVDWINVARVKDQDRSFVISINGNYLFARWVAIRLRSHCQPSWAEPNRFGLENKPTLWNGSIHTARRTEPDRAWPSVFPDWCLFLLASRKRILLRNRSDFLGLKCVCTQKHLFLVSMRLLHQLLSINENTCTWFDILAVQKCQLQCFQFGSARLAMGIVTRSARFSSVWSRSARLGLQCEWGLWIGSACNGNSHSLGPIQLGPVTFSSTPLGLQCEWGLWFGSACNGNSHSLDPVQPCPVTFSSARLGSACSMNEALGTWKIFCCKEVVKILNNATDSRTF